MVSMNRVIHATPSTGAYLMLFVIKPLTGAPVDIDEPWYMGYF